MASANAPSNAAGTKPKEAPGQLRDIEIRLLEVIYICVISSIFNMKYLYHILTHGFI